MYGKCFMGNKDVKILRFIVLCKFWKLKKKNWEIMYLLFIDSIIDMEILRFGDSDFFL